MRLKNAFLNASLALASLLVAIALAEWVLRLSDHESRLPYVNYLGRDKVAAALPGVPYLYEAHASFAQQWPSNPRGYFGAASNDVSYELNNFGFRDDDFTFARNEKARIAFLGDSFCFGNGVKGPDALASLVEEMLGPGVEVYNFCLAGFNTEQESALYRQVVRYFRPDAIVVWFFLNDINTPPTLYFDWHQQVGGEWLREQRSRWRLLDLIIAPFNRRANHRALVEATRAAYLPGHAGRDSVVRGLRTMAEINEEDHVTGFVVMFPWLYRLDQRSYPFLEAHRIVADLAALEQFQFLDLLAAFETEDAEDLWVYPTDQHPNEIGHRLAAAAVVDFLRGRVGPGLEQLGRNEASELVPPAASDPWYSAFRDSADTVATEESGE